MRHMCSQPHNFHNSILQVLNLFFNKMNMTCESLLTMLTMACNGKQRTCGQGWTFYHRSKRCKNDSRKNQHAKIAFSIRDYKDKKTSISPSPPLPPFTRPQRAWTNVGSAGKNRAVSSAWLPSKASDVAGWVGLGGKTGHGGGAPPTDHS